MTMGGRPPDRSPAAGRLWPFAAVLAAGLFSSCGGNPSAPAPTGEHPRLTIRVEGAVTLTVGQTLTVTVEETDASGRVVSNPPGSYTWSSSSTDVVDAGGGVLRAGSDLGYALVTVRSASGLSAAVHVWVQPPPEAPSTFRITLHFADDVPQRFREGLEHAAAKWSQVIRAELPAATLDGLTCNAPVPPLTGVERGVSLHVVVSDTFIPDTFAEAVGGPCVQRPLPRPTTILGRIALNRRKLDEVHDGRLAYLSLHEMGHTLGLVGVVQGRQPEWLDPRGNRYKGPLGLEGYRREFGVQVNDLAMGGGHWHFPGDIMGSLNIRISPVSVGALMDLGYPTAWYGAQ